MLYRLQFYQKYKQQKSFGDIHAFHALFFDLDGTIIDNSSERVFLKYLLEGGELPLRNLSPMAFLIFIRHRDLRQAKAKQGFT